jgi:hypothetical protein
MKLEEVRFGLTLLEKVREAAGLPDLDLSRVDNFIGGKYVANLLCSLTEDQVQLINRVNPNLFEDKDTEEITVSLETPINHTLLNFDIEKDPKTGEVLKARVLRKTDRARIIQDWIEAECPEKWDLTENKK